MTTTKVLRSMAVATLMAAALTTQAIPAKRGQWQTLQLAGGTTVEAQLKGNENLHYWEAADGRTYQATQQEDIYQAVNLAELAERPAVKNNRRGIRHNEFGVPTHYTGEKKGIIILVNYTDVTFKTANNQALFNRIANEQDFSQSPFTGSVRDYFTAQSYGQFDLSFDVVGPVTLSQNRTYYGKDSGGQGNDIRPGEMVKEACEAVNNDVSWTDYDWDGDGEVDQVFVLYAGQGQADGGGSNTIWPHEWELSEALGHTITLQGIKINTYACGPELNGSSQINGIGTICHEFSHCLGLPDFYDTRTEATNYGMGAWSLMDYGCYNNDGYTPCDYTGYERWFCGWITPTEIDPESELTVSDLKPINQAGDVYIIYNQAQHNEYYLLQNIRQEGWNSEAPGEGMLVMHVDYDKSVWQADEVNNTSSRQRCTIVPADNLWGGYDEANDPFPYGNRNSLGNTTTPAAKLYNDNSDGNKLLNVLIYDISENRDGTMSFSTKPDSSGQGENPGTDDGKPGEPFFTETFDQCNGTGGNDNKWSGTVATAGFNPDNQGWEAAKSYGANKCARFGSGSTVGWVTTPAITMPSGGKAYLCFKAGAWNSSKDGTSLLVEVEEGNCTLSTSELTIEKGAWTDCQVTLWGSGDVRITLTPTLRFVLDELTVCKPEATGIEDMTSRQLKNDGHLYDLSGRRMNTLQPGKGLYILNGRKYLQK